MNPPRSVLAADPDPVVVVVLLVPLALDVASPSS